MADVLDNNNGGQQGADGNNNGGTTPTPDPKTPTIEDLQLQLAEERAKAQKFKSSFDKVASEVAEYKKQL
jgi:hypothetical protein